MSDIPAVERVEVARDGAPAAEIAPLPAMLRRNAPLVPIDSGGGRALAGVIAILTFLAALCAGGAELVARNSAQWQGAVAREVTIQIRPNPQRDIEADVSRAVSLARGTPGVAQAQAYSKQESERLLEPWLGSGLDLGSLPVPRLVAISLSEGANPPLAELRRRLAAEVPGATLDDHGLWLSRLSTMASTVVGAGVVLVGLVLAAVALAVAFATRGAMAGNRRIVDVLHFVGAEDAYIAREFQHRFFMLGLKGAAAGGGGALLAFSTFGFLTASWRASAAGDQIDALFGTFEIGWRGYVLVILITLGVAVLTALISRVTVRRYLAEPS